MQVAGYSDEWSTRGKAGKRVATPPHIRDTCPHTPGMSESHAHPPSPRVRRANASHLARRAKPAERAQRAGYLRLHWRGELPLAAAVMVSAAVVWGVVQIVAFGSRRVSITDYPYASAALL